MQIEKTFSHLKDWEPLKIASSWGSILRIGQHDPESQVFFTVNGNGTHHVRDNPHRRRSQYPPQTTFQNDCSPESFQIYWRVVIERWPERSWNRFGQIYYYTCCSFSATFSGVTTISDYRGLAKAQLQTHTDHVYFYTKTVVGTKCFMYKKMKMHLKCLIINTNFDCSFSPHT